MKFTERKLNNYELVLDKIAEVRERGSRLSKIEMTAAEYADFYNAASNELVFAALQTLNDKKQFLGIQIVIAEDKSKR